MEKPIDIFQEQIITLAQYRDFHGINRQADVVANPDCAEVIADMEHLVATQPSITEFYLGALKNYKKGHPDSVADELALIKERVELMEDEELLTSAQAKKIEHQVATGEIVEVEARAFFKIFKGALPEVVKVPTSPRKKPSIPRQARTIDLTITEHGGISVNGSLLRELTPAQRVIILAGLAKGEGFRHNEITGSDELRQALGQNLSEAEIKEAYNEEFKALKTILAEKGLGRLVDPNQKPNAKKHEIVATSVVDKRPEMQAKPMAVKGRTPSARIGNFYEQQDAESPVAAASQEEQEVVFTPHQLNDTRESILRAMRSEGSVSRGQAVEMAGNMFKIDPRIARRLVGEVYRVEREGDNPAFTQKKNGHKKFVPVDRREDAREEQEHPLNGYFEGSLEEFRARYGETRGVMPDSVKYERGSLKLEGVEKAVITFFAQTRERKAIAEKQIISELDRQGYEISNNELRKAARVINRLVGKEFITFLPPASGRTAAKGPRIQMAGSFVPGVR